MLCELGRRQAYALETLVLRANFSEIPAKAKPSSAENLT